MFLSYLVIIGGPNMLRQLVIVICANLVSAAYNGVEPSTPSVVAYTTTNPIDVSSTARPYYTQDGQVGQQPVVVGNQYTFQNQQAPQYVSPNSLFVQVQSPTGVQYVPVSGNYEVRAVPIVPQNQYQAVAAPAPSYMTVTLHPPAAGYVINNQAPANVNVQARSSVQVQRPLVKTQSVKVEAPVKTKPVRYYKNSANPKYSTPAVTSHSVGQVQTVGQGPAVFQVQNVDQGQSQNNYHFNNYVQNPPTAYTATPVLVKSGAPNTPVQVDSRKAVVETPRTYFTSSAQPVNQEQNVVQNQVVTVQRPTVTYTRPAVVKSVQPESKVTVTHHGSVGPLHPTVDNPAYNVANTVQVAQQAPPQLVRYIERPAAVKNDVNNVNTPVYIRFDSPPSAAKSNVNNAVNPVYIRFDSAPQSAANNNQYNVAPQQLMVLIQPDVSSAAKASQPVEYLQSPQEIQYQAAPPVVHANSVIEKVYIPVKNGSNQKMNTVATPEPVYNRGLQYSDAASVSRVNFNGLGVTYGW